MLISIVCMSHSHVHAYSSSSFFIDNPRPDSTSTFSPSTEFLSKEGSSIVKQATAPPDPPAVRCLERLAAIERRAQCGIGSLLGLCLRKHQPSINPMRGRIDCVRIPHRILCPSVDFDAELRRSEAVSFCFTPIRVEHAKM